MPTLGRGTQTLLLPVEPTPPDFSYRESDFLYKALFDSSLDAVMITAPEGRIVDANAAACALFGRTADELRRLGRAGIIDPHDPRVPAAIAERRRTGRFIGEINFLRTTGEAFTAELSSAIFRTASGDELSTMVIRDVSARKLAEQALRSSEETHRGLLEAAFDGIVIHQDGAIVSANEAYATMFGYRLVDLPGRPVLDLVAPEARAWVAEKIATNNFSSYATVGLTRDGTRIMIETTARACVANGRPARVAAVRDVTARERNHQELMRLASIVTSSDDAIIGKTLSGVISTWNPAAEHIFGYTAEEAVGQPMLLLIPEERWCEEEQILSKVRAGESVTHLETVRRHKDGRRIDISATISPILSTTGEIIGASTIARDITESKASEATKRQLEVQLAQSQRLETIGTLAGGIAHDFNNILTGLVGFIELSLQSLPGDHEAAGYLKNAIEGGLRARDLVKRLLLFARQAPSTTLRPISLSKLVDETKPLLSALLPTSIAIRSLSSGHIGSVMADSGQLQQVLMNLCVNAAHAIGAHHGTITLELAEVERASIGPEVHPHVRLSVKDDGCGMDEATQEKIFDPFFTTKPLGEGTGLGLSIVHGIIKGHGGYVKVVSAPGKGTSFDVYLPLTPDGEAQVPTASAHAETLRGAGRHVLVADDEAPIRQILATILARAGFSVTTCVDGATASAAFLSAPERWDLAVIDLSMPGRTGLELISEIRARRPTLSIILMSGDHDRYGHDCPGAQPGVTRLEKPFSVEAMRTAVSSALPDTLLGR